MLTLLPGSSFGGIVFPIMLNQLIFHSSIGLAWSIRITAFVVLGLLIIANLLMSDRPEFTRRSRPKPNYKAMLTDLPFILIAIG